MTSSSKGAGREASLTRSTIEVVILLRGAQVHELDDMMESSMARDGVRRPSNGSAPQSWDGWLDADAVKLLKSRYFDFSSPCKQVKVV